MMSSLRKIARKLGRKFTPRVTADIRGQGNIFIHKAANLSRISLKIVGNHNLVKISPGCSLNNVTFFIRGNHHQILIQENCKFKRGGSIWILDHHGLLQIGPESTFEDVHLAVSEPHSQMTIGKNCMFAYDIDVRTGDSHAVISLETGERINYAQNVSIGDHVWVSAHSHILKGVTIPSNSIVATGAVVTRQFDKDGVILAGNPARVIKEGITWNRKRDNAGDSDT